MARSTSALLGALEKAKAEFGGDAAAHKRDLITTLADAHLRSARELVRFHEVLCFVRAYPDDANTLELVERVLGAFDARADLRAVRDELWNSGVAGTEIWFRFYWATARWIARRWPGDLTIDWADFENKERIVQLLPLLLPYTESPGLDEVDHTAREWIELLKAPGETDAAFLVRRFEALATDEFGREALYDALDVPTRLQPGSDTPSRTKDRWPGARVVFQERPLDRGRPDLRADARVPPLSVESVAPREGRTLIELARRAMVTRSRDLDAFCNADPEDVRVVDCGEGLCFALLGAVPERRLMLESSYGLLTIRNGMPIGYVLISAAFGSAAIAYNVFETFRGGEAAKVLGRVMAVAHHVFGVDAFSVDPYQLGHHNDEGLRSGAWWFYQKLGFRPADRDVQRLMKRELAAMKKDRSHRSDLATMRALVVDHVYFHLGEPRDDVLGRVSLGQVGLAVSRSLAERFGGDREGGLRTCAREVTELCGTGPDRSWTRGEKLWWQRWSPVLLTVPGVADWSADERRAAAEVVRSKGGRHESEFVRRLDAHPKLRAGLLVLARQA